jgi:UTP--glucose-1-phosphate uridylyltransferase
MPRPLRKAVFPVAGFGSRFLPATKASPKEMMPVVDKPLIQYAVEEAAAAGITDMIFITGRLKRAIEDHFDKAYEIESELEAKGKRELLDVVQGVLPPGCRCIFTRQPEPLGLGHAVLCAQPVVGDEPFAVLLADDLIDADPPVIAQMAERFAAEQCSILGVMEVAREQTSSYGIVSPERPNETLSAIRGLVEKPAPGEGAVHARGGRPLRAHAARVRQAGARAARKRRRDPAHRRHRRAARRRAGDGLPLRAGASTAARSSAIWRRPWSSA